jgi:hypothetical protein
MGPVGPQRAGNFPKSRRGVKNMLEDILSNDEIESFIGECLVLELLAAVTREGMGISKTQRRIVLRRDIRPALLASLRLAPRLTGELS